MREVLSFTLFLSLGIFNSFSQEEKEIHTFVEEEAQYPGGTNEMLKFLSENIKYPRTALEAGIQGRAVIRFIVEKNGSIGAVTVARGVPNCPECDAEAVRVVKSMPDWTPGKVEGKPVRSYYNLPVSYKLTNPEEKE